MGDQREVIEFLADPANHGSGKHRVERITTHISEIFLVGKRAYKLKRAVILPYLDFSEIKERKRCCRAELAINQANAPELYRRIRKISRGEDGRLSWDQAASAVDWVVEMKRFDQTELFDHRARSGQIDKRDVELLADSVIEMHQRGEITSQFGGSDSIARVIAGNEGSFRAFPPSLFPPGDIASLTQASEARLQQCAALLERRRLGGRVRRCHGDLHLGNICVIDGKPVLFDAIEFNDLFAAIDCLYDLAFLLMDFERLGLGEFACLLLSRYQAAMQDIEGLAALPLFLSLRAAIRAHIAAGMARPDEARDDFARARAYLQVRPARLIAIGGLSGSGKSNLSRRLAPFIGARPGALVLRSDLVRKYLMGVAPEARLPQTAYDEKVTDQVYQQLLAQAEQALLAGHSVIIDAVSARAAERRAFAALGERLGVPFRGLWLEAERAALFQRVTERRHNASDATAAVVEQQLRYDLGAIDWVRIDSSGEKANTLAAARHVLGI